MRLAFPSFLGGATGLNAAIRRPARDGWALTPRALAERGRALCGRAADTRRRATLLASLS